MQDISILEICNLQTNNVTLNMLKLLLFFGIFSEVKNT